MYNDWYLDPTQEIEEEPIRERLKTDRGLGWYVNRPLMGRNVGSRKGAERFGELMGEGYSGPSAFLRSMPAYARGWKQGLLGEAPDVSGADLFSASDKSLWHDPTQKTEAFKKWWSVPGYEENKWEPSIGGGLGALLDLMDPTLATAPGEAALGKVGAGLAGRYGAWEMAMREPEIFGSYQPIRDLLGMAKRKVSEITDPIMRATQNIPASTYGKKGPLISSKGGKSYNLQVISPSKEDMYRYPKMLIGPSEEITPIYNRLQKRMGLEGTDWPLTGGYYSQVVTPEGKWQHDLLALSDEIFGQKYSPKEIREIFGHEIGHKGFTTAKGAEGYKEYGATQLPQGLLDEIDRMQKAVTKRSGIIETGSAPTAGKLKPKSLLDEALYNYWYMYPKKMREVRAKSPHYENVPATMLAEESLVEDFAQQSPELFPRMLNMMAKERGKLNEQDALNIIKAVTEEIPHYIMPGLEWENWIDKLPYMTGTSAARPRGYTGE